MQIPGYTIIKKINAGGMATVFLATQHSVGRIVALKIMKPAFDKDPEFHQRFQREATIIGQLSHPNIIPIYDIGRHEGFNYISMEFLPKGSLEDAIKQGIDIEQAIRITSGIAAALEQAHSKGYIHRDIKPENILFREDGSPVLTDFGIARTIKSNANMTQVGTVIGTPYYMSPEQAKGEASDGRSDLYSLGVVLYEMLTGEKLFHADSSLAISVKHIHEQPPLLPPDLFILQNLLDKLLAKKPEQRFQTARELIDELNVIALHLSAQKTQGNKSQWQQPVFAVNKILKQDFRFTRNKIRNIFRARKAQIKQVPHPQTAPATIVAHTNTQLATRVSPATTINFPAKDVGSRNRFARFAVYLVFITGGIAAAWSSLNNEQPSAREQWASLTGQQIANATTGSLIPLSVNPIPKEARVRILNIRDKYEPGIQLPEGTYHLEISSPGFSTKKKWIKLTAQNSIIDIALQKNNQPRNSNELPLPELVLIPAGNFLMGNLNSQNAKQVAIAQDFYISRYEVTFNEYDFFAIETNRALPDDNGWGRGERPVINVSWDDAIAYTNWLNKTTGKTYRLPTAAEWEYAARGNTTSSYWWGNNPEDARERANCRVGCKSWWDSFFDNKPQVVGAFPPNDFGLHDTAGNIAEWTSDCADKIDATTPQPICLKRAVRGGSFASKVQNITAHSQTPIASTATKENIGFRLAQELPPIRIQENQTTTPENKPRRRGLIQDIRDTIFK